MQKIFICAVKVVIWLGEGAAETFSQKSAQLANWSRQLVSAVTHTAPAWSARVWTLQEFISSRSDPFFYFAGQRLSLHGVRQCVTTCRARQEDWSAAMERFVLALEDRIVLKARLRDEHGYALWMHSEDLMSLLLTTSGSQATDPHDFVYAIAGLLNKTMRERIHINYTRAIATTFAEATLAAVETQCSLLMLALVRPLVNDPSSHIGRPTNLPSWVVNFAVIPRMLESSVGQFDSRSSVSWEHPSLLHKYLCRTESMFRVVEFKSKNGRVELSHLAISGSIVDQIAAVTHRLQLTDNGILVTSMEGVANNGQEPSDGTVDVANTMRTLALESNDVQWWVKLGAQLADYDKDFFSALDSLLQSKPDNIHCPSEGAKVDSLHTLQECLRFWVVYLSSLGQGTACLFVTKRRRLGLATSPRVGDHLATCDSMKAPAIIRGPTSRTVDLFCWDNAYDDDLGREAYGFRPYPIHDDYEFGGFAYVHDAQSAYPCTRPDDNVPEKAWERRILLR
jgi:hypothetical protein